MPPILTQIRTLFPADAPLFTPLAASHEFSGGDSARVFGSRGLGDDGNGPRTTAKFLIVDDEPMLIRTALRGLRNFQLSEESVLTAHSAQEAIRAFDAHEASILALLTDMMMPGDGTGLDVYRHARAKRPDLSVGIWSGGMPQWLEKELATALTSDPKATFLEKPVALASLTAWFRGAWMATSG